VRGQQRFSVFNEPSHLTWFHTLVFFNGGDQLQLNLKLCLELCLELGLEFSLELGRGLRGRGLIGVQLVAHCSSIAPLARLPDDLFERAQGQAARCGQLGPRMEARAPQPLVLTEQLVVARLALR